MQDIGRRSGTRLLDAVVEFFLIPLRKQFRFVLRQTGLHRKVSLRQIQCAFQIDYFGHMIVIVDQGRDRIISNPACVT